MTRAEKAVIFLEKTAPELLQNLTPDTPAHWGILTPQHMVEHLQYVTYMSAELGPKRIKIVSPWWARPFFRLFVLGYQPLPHNINMPGKKTPGLLPLQYASLSEAKARLQQTIADTLRFFSQNPGLRTNHPFAGPFSPDDWKIFHQRHFTHHFVQVGLLTDYQGIK
jgi:oxepin-CoA hydrolase/3-oxo-5,6-dehydrosuberyl-CoA semialdehyde dehydrogenase